MVFILVIQLARLPIDMVRDVARDFLMHLNGILANFNYCDLQTKYRIFVSYCTSYYESCLWDLQHKLVDVFYTTLGGCPFNGPLSGMKYPTRTKSTTLHNRA